MIARKKILVLTSTYPRWKNDHEPSFVHELARRQAAAFDVLVLTPHAKNSQMREVLDGVDVRRFRYAPGRFQTLVNDGGIMANLQKYRWKWLLVPFFFIASVLATARIIFRDEISAIHAHWIIPQGLVAVIAARLSGKRIPILVTAHGADLYALRGRLAVALKRWVLRNSVFVTVVSRGMIPSLQLLQVPKNKMSVLPMGVDVLKLFTPDTNTQRSQHKLLFVGRLVEKKGLHVLIDALPVILKAVPHIELEIVGFGPEEALLRARVVELGLSDNVIFCGAMTQSELPRKYRRATICVAPFVRSINGDQDGLGLVSVEAIACGCPVITSDLPATADVIENEALRVPSGNSAALAEAVVRLLSMTLTERAVLAAAQRDVVMERLSWEHVASGYESLLRKLVEQGSTSA